MPKSPDKAGESRKRVNASRSQFDRLLALVDRIEIRSLEALPLGGGQARSSSRYNPDNRQLWAIVISVFSSKFVSVLK